MNLLYAELEKNTTSLYYWKKNPQQHTPSTFLYYGIYMFYYEWLSINLSYLQSGEIGRI